MPAVRAVLGTLAVLLAATIQPAHGQTPPSAIPLELEFAGSPLIKAFNAKFANARLDPDSLPWPRQNPQPGLVERVVHVLSTGERYLFEHRATGRVYFVAVNRLNGVRPTG